VQDSRLLICQVFYHKRRETIRST